MLDGEFFKMCNFVSCTGLCNGEKVIIGILLLFSLYVMSAFLFVINVFNGHWHLVINYLRFLKTGQSPSGYLYNMFVILQINKSEAITATLLPSRVIIRLLFLLNSIFTHLCCFIDLVFFLNV